MARPSAEVDDYRGEVARLQQELHERDREALLADVEIGHLPEERGENVVRAVTVLAARLGVALDERDIVFAERVGAPPTPAGSPGAAPPARPRRVVLRLSRRGLRDQLLQAARVRRSIVASDAGADGAHSRARIFVNERLTRTNRRLFYLVREECRRLRWRFAWTRRGTVYARQSDGSQAFAIKSDADLARVFGSLNTGQIELAVAIDELKPDILAINETWLREGDSAPAISGYRFVHIPRHHSIKRGRGGGVGFYIRRGVNARVCPHPVVSSVEQMWLRLSVASRCIIIGTAYRAPWQDVVAHLDALTDTITSFPNCDNLILAGDLNIDLLDSKNTKIPVLQQFLHCLNLKQIIAQPTHFHDDQTQTLIDIVCTNTSFKTVATKHTPELGRHAMLVVEFRIKKEIPKPQLIATPLTLSIPTAINQS
ncbi:unnamed protein product [Euphydryas editha]|uniref:Endonuclease/exonuclease/phosphatase domain-containing protein n=1 Tax=Euphydryas editha TaxID=104508 RepID=A0AAU9VA93_EUPED|nr:unnamed protein product [Euphydryas editha]